MKFIAAFILFILFFSCSEKINKENNPLKSKLKGEWRKIKENQKVFDFYHPTGFAFSEDSVEFFNGFFKRKIDLKESRSYYKYMGSRTSYYLKSDSIFINDLAKGSTMFWKSFFKLNSDTLILIDSSRTKHKYYRLHYKPQDSLPFDQITYSSSGCYGSCPIVNVSVQKNGNFLFHGEGYIDTIGFFKGKLNQKQVDYIFEKFLKADILNIDNQFSASHTDDQEITTTFIKDGQIVKTINDYGKYGPAELVWAYLPISYLHQEVSLKRIPIDDPFYPKLKTYIFMKDSLILPVKRSESFYLWTELFSTGQVVDTTFDSKYSVISQPNLVYWGPDPSDKRKHKVRIDKFFSDGRFYKFIFENDSSITFDLTYNFVDRNFKLNQFRKPKNWELPREFPPPPPPPPEESSIMDIVLGEEIDISKQSANFLEGAAMYEKWLSFHSLQHSDFSEFSIQIERKMKWVDYDLIGSAVELFQPYRIYSPDSTYFIDLDSYSLTIDKENDKLVSYGSEIDRKVYLVNTNNLKSAIILFCGTNCYPETAYWKNNKVIEVLGFSIDDENNFVPTIWQVDVNNMLFSEYQSIIHFSKMPESFMEKVRLKRIEFKE